MKVKRCEIYIIDSCSAITNGSLASLLQVCESAQCQQSQNREQRDQTTQSVERALRPYIRRDCSSLNGELSSKHLETALLKFAPLIWKEAIALAADTSLLDVELPVD
ncbi:hypothetical protein C5N92_06970 [Glaesserella australis]|uniref:Uncharacterized protein n=1 Tax=Glaesserella australis TaxID=2094024 RepID=A0A328BWH7_9PAST|nr:hypothetical protein CJD39_00680 [Glaesserella sp. 15-184]RAL18449.1 hypothetical protein C5N92_06970 [Glaesserella australis]